jgi:ornithine cyclodeaminase
VHFGVPSDLFDNGGKLVVRNIHAPQYSSGPGVLQRADRGVMKLLVLNHREVEALLPMEECIEAMAEALAALARDQVYQPLRMPVRPPGARGLIGLMPSYWARPGSGSAFGLKAVGVFPGNPELGKDAHQGAVLLFEGETGAPLALMNASAITAIRTAAVSALATRLLALESAGDLAIVGSGVQARSHLEALASVRALRRVRVASRRPLNAARFAIEMQPRHDFPIQAFERVEDALDGADLIVTATSSPEPVVRRTSVVAGAHLNVIGASLPHAREVDSDTMAAAVLFVDRRESTLNESGDFLIPLREGKVGPDHIRGELGELLIGRCRGRSRPHEITLFKSLGLAIEDLAAAQHVYDRARERRIGTWVDF